MAASCASLNEIPLSHRAGVFPGGSRSNGNLKSASVPATGPITGRFLRFPGAVPEAVAQMGRLGRAGHGSKDIELLEGRPTDSIMDLFSVYPPPQAVFDVEHFLSLTAV